MNHQLSVTLPLQPVYLDADPTRLTQVVGNLLNNACKFTDRGGHVWLRVERQGPEAVITVRDDGIGLAPEQLPRIFGMFAQVDTSLERSRGGLGIGLTLVRTLVEMHGGTVQARSAGVGQGSEFEVRLPTVAAQTRPSAPSPSSAVATTGGRRVLIVDDNQDGAESLSLMLRFAGHQAETAHDGLQAIEAAETLRPEAILLDIGLPGLNGYEVCRRIREQPWGANVLMVAVTGWGQDEDRQRSRDAGFDMHMVKPVDPEAILRLLASSPTGARSR
jgi:CheY-like chemotaxis protein